MANITLSTKLILRNDTASQWESVNPTLSAGEIGIDKTSGRVKIGDGVKTWKQLDWFRGSLESGSGAPTSELLYPVGTTYINTTDGRMYVCKANSGSSATWEKIAYYSDLASLGYGDMLKEVFATQDATNGFVDKAISVKDSTSGRTNNLKVNDSATGADVAGNNAIWSANKVKTELAGKADSSHSHATTDITNLTATATELNQLHNKTLGDIVTHDADEFAEVSHVHDMEDVTGLDTALAGKSDTGHTHQQSDVTGLELALAGKSDTSHTHDSLKKGNFTASLPTLDANGTIALTKDIPTAYIKTASVSGNILTVTDKDGNTYSSGDTVYEHPTSDGNKHLPVTGTTSNGKVLVAGSTAGSSSWKTLADAGIAPTASPTFTGTVTVPTPVNNTDAATKAYVDQSFAAQDAMVFKGTLGTGGTVTALPTSGYSAGWTYKVITAGTYAGKKCEIGDMVIAVKDFATTTSNDDWNVIQANIDGAVTTSATSATNEHIVVFDGTSGKVIKSGNKALPAGNLVGDTSYAGSTGGVIVSSTDNNTIAVDNSTGVASVNTITVDKLANSTAGNVLVLNGGTANS